MNNDTTSLIRDYYDISIIDKIETIEQNINKSSVEINKQIKQNEILVKQLDTCSANIADITEINKNTSQKIMDISNLLTVKFSDIDSRNNTKISSIENLLQTLITKIDLLDKKVDESNKFCGNLTKEINSIKSHVDTQMLNSNIEFNRYLNSAIRSHQPIGFHPSRVDKSKSLNTSQIL